MLFTHQIMIKVHKRHIKDKIVIMNDIMWDTLSYDEKNRELYLNQRDLLRKFLNRGAISRTQYDKSLTDLTEKMCYRKMEGKLQSNGE